MKLRPGKSGPNEVGQKKSSISTGDSTLVREPDPSRIKDRFEPGGGEPKKLEVPPSSPTGKVATFCQALIHDARKHPVAVVAVLGAALAVSACSPGPTREALGADTEVVATVQQAPTAQSLAVASALAQAISVSDTPLTRHVQEVRAELASKGLPTRADGVRVTILGSSDHRTDDLIRSVGHPELGSAPGATLGVIDGTSDIFTATHRRHLEAFNEETQAVRAGARPSEAWFARAISIELFESAESVYQLREDRKARGTQETEIGVMSRATSRRTISRALLEHLQAAPAGSDAAQYLAEIEAKSNGEDDTADLWQKLTREVIRVADTDAGYQIVRKGRGALKAQYDKARDEGIVIFRPSGDLRRDGDKESYSSGKDFSDGFEAPIAVGATDIPDGDGPPRILDATGTGWMMMAGPGVPFPGVNDSELHGSVAATSRVAGTAALMLRAAPNLTPDQLEYLMIDPSVLIDQEGTRDGLGFVQPAAAVSLASEAHAGRVTFPADRATFLFEKAVRGGVEVEADHPYVQYLSNIRSQLEQRGLPTRADGVKIFVVEARWSSHNGSVTRTIADPEVGIAPGADVRLMTGSLGWYNAREKQLSRNDSNHDASVRSGQRPQKQPIIDLAEAMVLSRAADVREVARLAPGDEAVLMNMSYGTTSASIAEGLVDMMESAPEGSEGRQLVESWGDETDDRLREATKMVADILASPEARAQIRPALETLGRELRAARSRGVLAFSSAGNARESWMDDYFQSAHVEAGVYDLVTVAALAMNDPTTLTDEAPTDFSSEGLVVFGTTGQDMPVGLRGDVKGTSFSSPSGVATAALMLAAYRDLGDGDLTPDQLESLFYRPGSTHDIPGHLDGLGALDVVAAVQAAADARSDDHEWLDRDSYNDFRRARLEDSRRAARPDLSSDES